MPKTVSFIVDGFNVYHSLKELQGVTKQSVKWLDLRRLCENSLQTIRAKVGDRVEIGEIFYFSALATHKQFSDPDHTKRHLVYTSALEATGVVVRWGRFQEGEIKCYKCGNAFKTHEEKETDVAIAVKLLEICARGICQVVVLISGDTDLVPATRSAKALFGGARQIGVAFPFNRHNSEPKDYADFHYNIRQRDILAAQFPLEVPLPAGGSVTKPRSW